MMLRSVFMTAIAFLLSACAATPDAKIYILNTVERTTSPLVLLAIKRDIAVKIGPVSVPDMLDQSKIITRSGTNILLADDFNRWSGNFQSDIERVLGENISILLPTKQVMLSQEVIVLPIDFQVIVNIREFDGHLGGLVTLNADWTVVNKNKAVAAMTEKLVVQEYTQGDQYQDYVATQSKLLGLLSEKIVLEIGKQVNKES